MTVKELIEKLKQFPEHMIVVVEDSDDDEDKIEDKIVDSVQYKGNSEILITGHYPIGWD